MASIYDIKPAFQRSLRPIVRMLAARGVTPNQITLLACLLSFVAGGVLATFIHHRAVFFLIPVVLFLRMALNAIDGMLAKEHDMKTPFGAILNELTDMLSDAVLYLPFALLPNVNGFWVVVIVILSIVTEATGLSALSIGASRRYDGPMGKSDRAFVFSIVAIALALGAAPNIWLAVVWVVIIVLLVFTISNRVRKALQEVRC